ncbi:MAG: dockerin type I repeat-containing protein, partial [Eubacterium sp.]|nr:dockerin type I repeat-containing protein [Eubacterium sp.]
YNNYLADVPNETVKKKVKVVKKKTTVTDADITSYFETYKTVDMLYTNRVVYEEWILTEDYTTYGSLTIEADVDLNGHTLTIGGNVDHKSGEILFHNGTLKIDGDYLNATPSVDSGKKEYYAKSDGRLNMVWDNDYMLVGGNFITNVYYGNCNKISMGNIEIKGDVLDYTDTNGGFWVAEDENKVILSGTGNQTIHFEISSSHFNDLEMRNSNSRTITIDKYCKVNGTTTSDKNNLKMISKDGIAAFGTLKSTSINATGNFELGNGSTTLNNSNITVNGNLIVSSDIDMDNCTIYVTGMLDHNEGTILFHNGTLKIDGDYLNATPSVDSGKKEYYAKSDGRLNMVWDNDYMLVGGNFITNVYYGNCNKISMGNIEIKGDVLDYTDTNGGFWVAEDENKVILSGTGNQTIHFEISSSHFNDLEIKNTNNRTIKLTGEFNANNIIIDGAVTINSSNKNATISNVTLKEGSSLTLTGNLNGITSINNATFTSDTPSSATSSSNVIKAVKNGTANITISNNDTSSKITVNAEKPFELGDINCDGEVTVADAVLLQKWLLAVPNTRLANWKLGDLCEDGVLNVFDLCLLKRKLIYG